MGRIADNNRIRPGDLIEWVFVGGNGRVPAEELAWSTVLDSWVPIGSQHMHMVVAVNDDEILWINDLGLFSGYPQLSTSSMAVSGSACAEPRRKELR